MIGAVTSTRYRYACFTLSRLSLTDFPLEFPSGVARCPDTTTALVVLNLAASNPMEKEDVCYIVVLRYGHSLPCKSFPRFIARQELTLHVKTPTALFRTHLPDRSLLDLVLPTPDVAVTVFIPVIANFNQRIRDRIYWTKKMP